MSGFCVSSEEEGRLVEAGTGRVRMPLPLKRSQLFCPSLKISLLFFLFLFVYENPQSQTDGGQRAAIERERE